MAFTWVIYSGLAVLGSVLGSFAVAQTWRLRAQQLVEDEKHGEAVSTHELARLRPLSRERIATDRSRCLDCSHQLAWYDLIPVVSWLSLRGKCRYCKQPIGVTELIVEILLAAAFVLSAWLWPVSDWLSIVRLVIWLVGLICLTVLFMYDSKWFLLPNKLNWSFALLGLIYASLHSIGTGITLDGMISLVGALAILPGLYGFLYVVSGGRWVGLGDVKLAIGLALFLGDWRLAFLALFVANLLGTLVVLPGVISGKLGRGSKVPFGPLLIAGFIVAFLAGGILISWYQSLLFL